MSTQHDLIVIGAGPGGYVAAIRAAQLGLNVACIEKESALGGTCLRVGCIPSKALLESSELFEQTSEHFAERGIKLKGVELDLPQMLEQKDSTVTSLTQGVAGLFKKNKITRYEGHAQLQGGGKVVVQKGRDETIELTGKHILIATGSVPATIPNVKIDGDRVVSSTEALTFEKVPETLAVIGAGAIGLEMGTVWRRLGSKVTVLEYLDRILPGMDGELAKQALKVFKSQGLNFQLGVKVTGVKPGKKDCEISIEGQSSIKAERVLVAVGRKPNTQNLGLDTANIETDARGFIPVNDHYQTTAKGVYAIGDVIGGAMLAHKAEEEGIACVEQIATGYGHVNYNAIPAIVYTSPEVASVGKTEEQLQEAGVKYKKGSFPFAANGRARAIGHTGGMVKILADEKTDRILGAHILGPHAGDLIAELAVAIEFHASAEDVARASHAHPTLAEAIKEAALAVDKRTIHI
ncbi:dihydrolipoyl dehydrogenase [Rubinisphaera brasiliensis]|uniref:Dihydrolipoyl dehydrogenase n=1 Tax=Rubinisphaera brasiliensis (strain ATCC 49424 / DSM 5305 / JCM 21570 / IAM 15109 / NBRC 103401 / IFAM 1448) TaxID=756272 RepID=F0SRJ5_RUBBR|nr:dihydrolipoyl dehydrogenase [Rubinisphaera brasiliensis]ADY58056.1 dihydrolipoamide dehydrogenase [Rubinisphaera brasiliensis DSM 5305]